jgi:hypothetical protein
MTEQIQSSGLDLRDLFHRESELYRFIPEVSESTIRAFSDPYLLYLHLLDVLNIVIQEDVLERRVESFFLSQGAPIFNLTKVNKIKLLILGERFKKIFPIGRPWERFEGESEERYLPTSGYVRDYVDKTYERLLLSKQAYEIRTHKPDPIYKPIFSKLSQLIKLQSESWIQKFDDSINREVEIRFSDISGTEFGNLLDYFLNSPKYYFNNIVSRVSILNGGIRETIFEESPLISKPFVQKKNPIGKIQQNDEWNFKVVTSEETLATKQSAYSGDNKRYKNSFKFYTPDNKSPFFNMEISLSIVTEMTEKPKVRYHRKYEVELERKFGNERYWRNRITRNPQTIEEAVREIIRTSQINPPVSFLEKKKIRSHLFSVTGRQSSNINLVSAIANKVLPFTKKIVLDFLSFTYFVSPKLDGDRKILLIKSRLGSFLLGLDGSILRIGPSFNTEGELSLVLDCEVEDKSIHIFDIIADSRNSFMYNKVFEVRQSYIAGIKEWIASNIRLYNEYNLNIKTFKKLTELNEVEPVVEFVFKNCNYDGIIFQSNSPYFESRIFKWKPRYMNTIDFLISENHTPMTLDRIPITNVNLHLNREFLPFRQHFSYSNFILECFYNPLDKTFYPCRIRFDKTYPNKINVVEDTLWLIEEPFTKENFKGYQLVFARRLINELKRHLLESYSGILLDIGSGQGGDINKWGHFSKVIAVEPDKFKIEEFLNRLENSGIKHKVTLQRKLFTKTTYQKIINGQFPDVITMFFSVNYVFESKTSVDDLLATFQSICDAKPCTILMLVHDGHALSKSKTKLENVVDIRTDPSSNKLVLTILGTNNVVNVTEYLFDIKYFEQVASQFFNVTVSSVEESMPGIKINNLSRVENIWLKTIKLIKLTKYEIPRPSSPYDVIHEAEDEEIPVISEQPDFESVEVEYPEEENPEEQEEEQEEDVIILEEMQEEEELIGDEVRDLPPYLSVVKSSGSSPSIEEVNRICEEIYSENCVADLQNKFSSLIWSFTKYSFVLLECLIKFSVVKDINSNQIARSFIVENFLKQSLTYKTEGNKKDIESLLFFNKFTNPSDSFVEGYDQNDNYVTLELKELPLNEKFLKTLEGNHLKVYVPLTHKCVIFAIYSGSREITTKDILSSIYNLVKNNASVVTDCIRIFDKKLFPKSSEQLVLAPSVRGITWKDNSCYADCVLMCMGASNMVKIYMELLSKSDFPVAGLLYTVLEQIYRNRADTASEEVIQKIGGKCGAFDDAVQFYRKLCSVLGKTLDIVIVKKDTTTEETCVIFKRYLDEKLIRSFKGANYFVVENTDEELLNLIGGNDLPKSDVKEQLIKGYYLQGCCYYVLPAHYICVFKRYNTWYLYDGMSKPNTVEKTKSFLLEEYKGKKIIPYLLFYLKI